MYRPIQLLSTSSVLLRGFTNSVLVFRNYKPLMFKETKLQLKDLNKNSTEFVRFKK